MRADKSETAVQIAHFSSLLLAVCLFECIAVLIAVGMMS